MIFNDGGSSFGADADATWNKTTNVMTINGTVVHKVHYGAIVSDSDGSTITFDLSAGDVHSVTLGGNRTLALSNGNNGQRFVLLLKQDGTGGRTVTWFSGITWGNGITPTLTATAAKTDVFSFIQTGAGAYLGFSATNF